MRKSITRVLVSGLTVGALLVATDVNATNYYVNVTGANTNDGLTAGTAWRTITYAFTNTTTLVSSGDVVNVAAGTYNTSSEVFPITMRNGITLQGNSFTNTTLSFDTGGGKALLAFSAPFTSGKVDGFTITYPVNSDSDYGVYVTNNCAPLISNCRFRYCNVRGNGYPVYVTGGTPILHNCVFVGNLQDNGGSVVYINGSTATATVENCTFVGNISSWAVQRAAGSALVRDSIFYYNRADVTGLTASMISNCCIQSGAFNGTNGCFKSDPLLTGGYFLSQVAAGQSSDSPCLNAGSRNASDAGMDVYSTRTDGQADSGLVDIGFHFPSGTTTGGTFYVSTTGYDTNNGSASAPWRTITRASANAILGSVINVAAGVYSAGETFPITPADGVSLQGSGWANCTILRASGGNQVLNPAYNSVSFIDGFTIKGSAAGDGGCGIWIIQTPVTISNCRITGNYGGNGGCGGIMCSKAQALIRNCLITANYASGGNYGGGIYINSTPSPVVRNCTIFANATGGGTGGGIYCTGSPTPVISDCIIWKNTGELSGVTAGMISYCDISDGSFNTTNHNFSADPLFVNGYYLSQTASGQGANSPCLDAGSQTAAAAGLDALTTRTDGQTDTGTVDIGFHLPPGLPMGGTYYVAMNGNDSSGTGSSGTPWRTITKAMNSVPWGAVVNVATGRYNAGEIFPITPPDTVSLQGSGWTNCVIDRNNTGGRVFYCQNTASGLIDGFTIRGAADNDGSGGITFDSATLTFSNCRVCDNRARQNGAGLLFQGSSLARIINCLIVANNSGGSGAGIYIAGGMPTIQNCTLSGNSADNATGDGITYNQGASPVIKDCILWNNGNELSGVTAAMISYCDVGNGQYKGTNNCIAADPVCTRGYFLSQTVAGQTTNSPCVDAGSQSATAAGLNAYATRTDGAIDSGTVDLGYHFPGGMTPGPVLYVAANGTNTNSGSSGAPLRTITKALSMAMVGSIINVATGLYNVAVGETFPLNMAECVALQGAGASNTIVDAAGGGYGVVYAQGLAAAKIDGFTLQNGLDGDYAAGVFCVRACPTISNNRINHNDGRNKAGGIECTAGSSAWIYNCLVISNYDLGNGPGGAIAVSSSHPTIESCTIVTNNPVTRKTGDGIYVTGTPAPIIRNCIVWNNGEELRGVTSGMISFCDMQDGQFNTTNRCFSSDPLFVASPTNLHLKAGSPCLDTGTNQSWMTGSTDLDGNPRLSGSSKSTRFVDLGAYEYQYAVRLGTAAFFR